MLIFFENAITFLLLGGHKIKKPHLSARLFYVLTIHHSCTIRTLLLYFKYFDGFYFIAVYSFQDVKSCVEITSIDGVQF